MAAQIQQRCPYCDVEITYNLTSVKESENEDGSVNMMLRAETTPESTEHVWTHAPEGATT
ncbi:hypothetical protein PP634_gp88 [Arthrobacter phage Richie]|uniref:Uncharacterized protein n=1 Tax=Arthrobacter phage Richie TaxID=2419967 RepID=A0A3G2KIV2_9CAUD|nr:hypothetical protein PP634_gp88 [Arthrobacter phage Richie]AYN58914.1 hypothetical protein PBI_RICHIE_88 [Arthrobacter phage Richie]UYL86645.1 hypothetical protein SEA_RADFAD_90 [Arthrobacter phage RadFad]